VQEARVLVRTGVVVLHVLLVPAARAVWVISGRGYHQRRRALFPLLLLLLLQLLVHVFGQWRRGRRGRSATPSRRRHHHHLGSSLWLLHVVTLIPQRSL
jgi:hypothetical protein